MRYVHEVAVTEDISQAVWGGVRLRNLRRRPKVSPPRDKRQHKEKRECDYYKNRCQSFSSHAHAVSNINVSEAALQRVLTFNHQFVRWQSMAKAVCLIEVSL